MDSLYHFPNIVETTDTPIVQANSFCVIERCSRSPLILSWISIAQPPPFLFTSILPLTMLCLGVIIKRQTSVSVTHSNTNKSFCQDFRVNHAKKRRLPVLESRPLQNAALHRPKYMRQRPELYCYNPKATRTQLSAAFSVV